MTTGNLLLIATCSLGLVFDLYELGLGNALVTVFSAPPHVESPTAVALLLSSVFLGAVAGAPMFGGIADRHGRRSSMAGALALLSIASLSGAASPNVAVLTMLRVLAGLGLGGFPPVVVAYLTDVLPANRRGRNLFFITALAVLGTAAAIFTVRALVTTRPLGIDAWRWALAVGGLGSAASAALFLFLPESPAWLASKALDSVAVGARSPERNSAETSMAIGAIEQVLGLPRLAPARIRLYSIYFLSPWSTVAFPTLMGALLIQKGFKLTDSLWVVGVSTLGPVIGAIAAAFGIDAIPRRTALIWCCATMSVLALVFAETRDPTLLLLTATGFYTAAFIYVPTMTLYGAEMVEPRHRARLLSSAWAFNRIGAAVAPLVLLPLAHSRGPMVMVIVIVVTLAVSFVLTVTAPRSQAISTW